MQNLISSFYYFEYVSVYFCMIFTSHIIFSFIIDTIYMCFKVGYAPDIS